MRKLDVDGTKFEWVAGHSFVRIRGNGHSVDLRLELFLEEECGKIREESYDMVQSLERPFGVEPSDVVRYIRKHNWLIPKTSRKRK